MHIKTKTLSRREWYAADVKQLILREVDDGSFRGIIGALIFTKKMYRDILKNERGEKCIAAPGYCWLQFLPADERFSMTAMFREDGTLFQCYFDVTGDSRTLLENDIAYTDHFLDVVFTPGEPPRLLDEDELAQALEEGVITQTDSDKAWETANGIMQFCTLHADLLVEKLYTYYTAIMVEAKHYIFHESRDGEKS